MPAMFFKISIIWFIMSIRDMNFKTVIYRFLCSRQRQFKISLIQFTISLFSFKISIKQFKISVFHNKCENGLSHANTV